ncbi:MAG: 4-hydroxy-tetrahydrodipicolinate reductase [SAR324 cluster bacterium]|nr:4-hydroxy-tetrahydrodipicolinate reductase [SAR324 cluster bacterium]
MKKNKPITKSRLKVALIGYGKMGQVVFQAATSSSKVLITSTIDSHNPLADFKNITEKSLNGAEVAICFTQPDGVLETIKDLVNNKVKIVMATTGWENQLALAKLLIKKNKGALIASANFSLGVLIYFEMIKHTSQLINKFNEYDLTAFEMHHHKKLDSPSGTMKKIGALVLDNVDRKKRIVSGSLNRELKPDELHLGFARGGDIVGSHQLRLDSTFDTITLTHEAKTRKGFAVGTLLAANWIKHKNGWFNEQDLVTDLVKDFI